MFHWVIQPRSGHCPLPTPALSRGTRLVTTSSLPKKRCFGGRGCRKSWLNSYYSFPSDRWAPIFPVGTDPRDSITWISRCLSQMPGGLCPSTVSPAGRTDPLCFLSGGALLPLHPHPGRVPFSYLFRGPESALVKTPGLPLFTPTSQYLLEGFFLKRCFLSCFTLKLLQRRVLTQAAARQMWDKFCGGNRVLSCGKRAGGGSVLRTRFPRWHSWLSRKDGHFRVTIATAFWISEEELPVRSFWQFFLFFLKSGKSGSFTKIHICS